MVEETAGEASPEGRLLIGRGEDYVASTVPAQELFDTLKASMAERRKLAWHIVEEMLRWARARWTTSRSPVRP